MRVVCITNPKSGRTYEVMAKEGDTLKLLSEYGAEFESTMQQAMKNGYVTRVAFKREDKTNDTVTYRYEFEDSQPA